MKKRILRVVLACVTAMSMAAGTVAMAEEQNLDVVLIGGPEEEATSEPVSLDDIKLGEAIEIPDYAIFTPTECVTVDTIKHSYSLEESGQTAEYLVLYFSLLNLRVEDVDFNVDISSIVVTYDDKYQYAGWTYQRSAESHPENGIDSEYQFSIGPMYEGLYMVGCTLPNAVVEGSEPLVLTFMLGENEVTYYIRE